MTATLRQHPEKVAAALALGALATITVMTWRQHAGDLARMAREPVGAELTGDIYLAGKTAGLRAIAANWPKPAPQSGGRGWLYEVFTPPVIYFNPLARTFSVTAPGDDATGAAFGFELIGVELEPYRLQLAGYYGVPDELVGAFTSRQLAAPLLGRNGRNFPELGLTLRRLEVRKVPVNPGDAVPAFEVAAIATLFDERAGAEVTLDSRARKLTDTPLARLRLATEKRPREFREGDEFTDSAATYRVERVQLDPPEVVISRQVAGLPFPETKVLRPAGVADTKSRPKNFSEPAQREMAAKK
jgi:hypothetical protein